MQYGMTGRVVNRQFTGASTDAWENGSIVNNVIFNTSITDGISIGWWFGTRTISFTSAGAISTILVFFAISAEADTSPSGDAMSLTGSDISIAYGGTSLSKLTNDSRSNPFHLWGLTSDSPTARSKQPSYY